MIKIILFTLFLLRVTRWAGVIFSLRILLIVLAFLGKHDLSWFEVRAVLG